MKLAGPLIVCEENLRYFVGRGEVTVDLSGANGSFEVEWFDS